MFEFLKNLFLPARKEINDIQFSGDVFVGDFLVRDISQLTTRLFLKCRVCGTAFPPSKDAHYLIVDDPNGETKSSGVYDAFDCPVCKCQIPANKRMRRLGKAKEPLKVLYLCDKKVCERCCYPLCSTTSDISHAVSFKKNNGYYVEVQDAKDQPVCDTSD